MCHKQWGGKKIKQWQVSVVRKQLVCCLTCYILSGSSSLCAISPFSRQELCLGREQHRAAGISPLLHCGIAHLQFMAPKQVVCF